MGFNDVTPTFKVWGYKNLTENDFSVKPIVLQRKLQKKLEWFKLTNKSIKSCICLKMTNILIEKLCQKIYWKAD